jgi:hypothetical protein
MGLLVLFTLLVIAAAVAATVGFKSRSEALVALSLVANAIVIGPIYGLGLLNRLTRPTLAVLVVLICGVILGLYVRRADAPGPALRALGKRALVLALLPFEAIVRSWRQRSLLAGGALLATLVTFYMAIVAYLAPNWRDWDSLWYHESLIGFTIQNHGFSPVELPQKLQIINGAHRLCEMTQLWFGIWAGRRLVDMTNIFFLPLLAASAHCLVVRYTRDRVTGIAAGAAFVLIPGVLRLVQSTMVDPQAAALLLAAAYWVTHPELDRRAGAYAVLALTLAVGAKIWSIVPCTIFALVLLVRLLRRWRENSPGATALLVLAGTAGVVGMQAVTYLRNLIYFHNPFWPMLQIDNDRLGIHWKGIVTLDVNAKRAGVDFNDPFPDFVQKMLAGPWSVTGPGHTWQVNDYGFAWAWVLLPLAALATTVVTFRWITSRIGIVTRLRRRSASDDATSGAMILALVASISLYVSPALFIARYHIASLGMLVAAIAWLVGRPGRRLLEDALLLAQIGSFLMAMWAPKRQSFNYLYEPVHLMTWLKTPYPRREGTDVGTPAAPRYMVSPILPDTLVAREAEVKEGDDVAFDNIDFIALLWNNAYSNKVVWTGDVADPLAQAEKDGAVWIYTHSGSALWTALMKPSSGWKDVGALETEQFGHVWHRKPK